MRLDTALVAQGLARSRSAAQHLVADGAVLINGVVADKPSRKVPAGAQLTTDPQRSNPWVSRGGLKLDAALTAFGIDVAGVRALDVGASTGGFSQVLLSRGAASVTALDVGHSQLHPSLAEDSRVKNLESTNVRHVSRDTLGGVFDVVVVDVSFISLTQIADVLADLCGGDLVVLVKPQFEVGRKALGKGGVVRNHDLYEKVLSDIVETFVGRDLKFRDSIESPVEGGDGNVEFVTWFSRQRP